LSQSHRKFFQVESELSHDLVGLSESELTRAVKSPRLIGFEAQVNVESSDI